MINSFILVAIYFGINIGFYKNMEYKLDYIIKIDSKIFEALKEN